MASESKDMEVMTYKLSEIIGMVKAWLSKQNENAKIVFVEGIYRSKTDNPKYDHCYDLLSDEASGEEISIAVPRTLRKDLAGGKLVTVGGFLNRWIQKGGTIQLQLRVTRIVGQQVVAISEAEAERMVILQEKRHRGYRNLDSALERKLYNDERPKVALLLAVNSITKADFESAIHAARANVDFCDTWSSFADKTELCQRLRLLDESGYDAIAVVRGGGTGIEQLDEVDVLRTVVAMKTPVISAVGHVEERLAFKEIVDKEVPTPTGLGEYFSRLCERVISEKEQSKAVLVAQVKKQFEAQIVDLKKQLEKREKENWEERALRVARERQHGEIEAEKGRIQGELKKLKELTTILAIGLAVAVVWIVIGLVVGR